MADISIAEAKAHVAALAADIPGLYEQLHPDHYLGTYYVRMANQWPGFQPSYGNFKDLYLFDRIGGYPTGWKFWEQMGCR